MKGVYLRSKLKVIGLVVISAGVIGGIAGLFLLAGLANPGSRLTASGSPGAWTVEDASAFPEYPVLWLGAVFEGLPLKKIIRDIVDDNPASPIPTARDGFILIYGDCTPEGESSCSYPLSMRVDAYCFMPPEIIPDYLKEKPDMTRPDGARMHFLNGQVHLFTGEVAVTIWGREELRLRAVDALSVMNNQALRQSMPALMAPTVDVCEKIQGRNRADVPFRALELNEEPS